MTKRLARAREKWRAAECVSRSHHGKAPTGLSPGGFPHVRLLRDLLLPRRLPWAFQKLPLAERLAAHSSHRGHRVFVIYVDPRHREVFDKTGCFRVMRDDPDALVLGAPQRDAALGPA